MHLSQQPLHQICSIRLDPAGHDSLLDKWTAVESIRDELCTSIRCTDSRHMCHAVSRSNGSRTITAASCRLLKLTETRATYGAYTVARRSSSATNRLVRSRWLDRVFAGRFTRRTVSRMSALSNFYPDFDYILLSFFLSSPPTPPPPALHTFLLLSNLTTFP